MSMFSVTVPVKPRSGEKYIPSIARLALRDRSGKGHRRITASGSVAEAQAGRVTKCQRAVGHAKRDLDWQRPASSSK